MSKFVTPESIVEVKVSGAFYARLQQLLLSQSEGKSPEDIKKAVDAANEGVFVDAWSYHYATLLIIVSSVEQAFIEQNKTIEKEITEEDLKTDS
jgi:hypothetical protein